jgi:hypothetical protein
MKLYSLVVESDISQEFTLPIFKFCFIIIKFKYTFTVSPSKLRILYIVSSKGLKLWSFYFGITEPSLNTSLNFVPFTFSALWLFVVGALGFVLVCSYSGMLIFATYYDCDPLTTKVWHSNRLLFLQFSATVIIRHFLLLHS